MTLTPLGWVYNGELHLLHGVTLNDLQDGTWSYMGRIVDADGQLLREALPIDDDDD